MNNQFKEKIFLTFIEVWWFLRLLRHGESIKEIWGINR